MQTSQALRIKVQTAVYQFWELAVIPNQFKPDIIIDISLLFQAVCIIAIRWLAFFNCMYVCMKSVFILAYLATICWLMWIIQSPTSSLFPAPCLVLERDLSCSTSLSYRPVSSFIQLYLYRLLAATNSGSLLPFDYTWILLSQTEPT